MKKIMALVAAVCATLNMNANVIDTDQFSNINVVDTTFHLNPDSSRVALKRNRYLIDNEQTKSHILSASTSNEWGSNWFVGAQAGIYIRICRQASWLCRCLRPHLSQHPRVCWQVVHTSCWRTHQLSGIFHLGLQS